LPRGLLKTLPADAKGIDAQLLPPRERRQAPGGRRAGSTSRLLFIYLVILNHLRFHHAPWIAQHPHVPSPAGAPAASQVAAKLTKLEGEAVTRGSDVLWRHHDAAGMYAVLLVALAQLCGWRMAAKQLIHSRGDVLVNDDAPPALLLDEDIEGRGGLALQ